MEINSRDLDNYITGRYGADQLAGQPCDDIEDDGMCPYTSNISEKCKHFEDGRCGLFVEREGEP